MPDILYVSFNRMEFTRASFDALIANTNWEHVEHLYVHDDGSTDGTAEWLADNIGRCPVSVTYERVRIGGPVAAMNWYLDLVWPAAGAFIKIDNDYVVCPGWLDEIRKVAAANLAEFDVIGFAPQFGPSVAAPAKREIEPAQFIGGIGLIRHRIFEACRPVSGGLMGWWAFQDRHTAVTKGWVRPDMPCFELDRLPVEPWASLSADYVERGWQRDWGRYDASSHDYWDWWIESQARVSA